MYLYIQIPPDCIALSPMGVPMAAPPMPTLDARLMPDGIPRPEHDKARQNFVPNQYVELIL